MTWSWLAFCNQQERNSLSVYLRSLRTYSGILLEKNEKTDCRFSTADWKFILVEMLDRIDMIALVLFFVMFIFVNLVAFLDPIIIEFFNKDQIVYGISDQKVYDSKLRIEKVYEGLEYPTSMTFIGPNDILVTEKDKGTVQRIIDGKKIAEPVFDAAVANENERGLLGIAYVKNSEGIPQVYLYFTESNNSKDSNDYCPKIISCASGNDPLGARLFRYDLDKNTKLENPKLILDLPAKPGSDHIGGGLLIGPDKKNLYLTVGDGSMPSSLATNVKNGTQPDGRGGILKVPINYAVEKITGVFGSDYPLNLYYAYGIRNGFGLDFDPLTGNLWDTENGKNFGDEINLVEPGFNSGWNTVQGIYDAHKEAPDSIMNHPENSLVQFRNGKYSVPEFTWTVPVGVTAIKFFDSDKLGKQYENDLFVADIHKGNVYDFNLNKKRTGLLLEGNLSDKVADYNEDSKLVFASGFHGITDIEIGPDGYMYLLSFHSYTHADRHHYYGNGAIFRIVPQENPNPKH